MKINQLKVGSILSYVQMALNVIVGLVYTPLMVRMLGESEYGLYNTIVSTVSMLTILNLGFNSGYIKFYSRYKAKNEQVSIYKLNGLFLIIFLIIGAVAFGCGLFLTYNLDVVFSNGLTVVEYEIAEKLMVISTINLALSFPMTVFMNIVSAHEKFVFLKLLGMAKTVLSPMLSIPLLFMGYGSVVIVGASLVISLVTDCVYIYYVLFVLKSRFVFCDFESGIFRRIFKFTSFIALNMIIDQINWNIDKIILGRYHGTTVVAIYSVGATLNTYYQSFSTSISGIFTPRIHRIVSSGLLSNDEKKHELTSLFTRVGRIQYLLLALVASGFVLFGRDFIRLWVGEGFSESYYVALLLILPITIPLIQNLGIEIQRAQNQHQFRSMVYACMAGANLISSVFLAKIYGAVGATIGTSVSLLLGNGLIMNIFYYKKCGINILSFWKDIVDVSRGLIIPVAVGGIMQYFLNFNTALELLLGLLCYALVYCLSMWYWGMNDEEKQLVSAPIQRIFCHFSKGE